MRSGNCSTVCVIRQMYFSLPLCKKLTSCTRVARFHKNLHPNYTSQKPKKTLAWETSWLWFDVLTLPITHNVPFSVPMQCNPFYVEMLQGSTDMHLDFGFVRGNVFDLILSFIQVTLYTPIAFRMLYHFARSYCTQTVSVRKLEKNNTYKYVLFEKVWAVLFNYDASMC